MGDRLDVLQKLSIFNHARSFYLRLYRSSQGINISYCWQKILLVKLWGFNLYLLSSHPKNSHIKPRIIDVRGFAAHIYIPDWEGSNILDLRRLARSLLNFE